MAAYNGLGGCFGQRRHVYVQGTTTAPSRVPRDCCRNVFLTKYSSMGDRQWFKVSGIESKGVLTLSMDTVAVSPNDGSVYTFANYDMSHYRGGIPIENSPHDSDVYDSVLIKYSASSEVQWTEVRSNPGAHSFDAHVAVSGDDGSIYLTNSLHQRAFLNGETLFRASRHVNVLKISSSGDMQWTEVLHINDGYTRAAAATSGDGGVYVTGTVSHGRRASEEMTTPFSPSTRLRATSNGPSCWASTAWIPGLGVAVSDNDGSVYITGHTKATSTMRRASEQMTTPSTKYSSSGDKQWTRLLGVDGGGTRAYGVAVSDADGSVHHGLQHRRQPRRGDAHRNRMERLSHQVLVFGR